MNLRPLNGECVVEIRTLVEDEIEFNGSTLKIVADAKDFIQEATVADANAALEAYKKSGYKDEKAIAEYTRMMGELNRQKEEREDVRAKQSVRKGILRRVCAGGGEAKGFDYTCEFDGEEGDEIFFDPYYSHAMLEDELRYFEDEDKKFILVAREAIFARKRNGEIEGLNGFIIGKRLGNELRHGVLYLPDSNTERVEVVVPNRREPKYRSKLWSNTKVKKGDIVCMDKWFAIPLDSTMGSDTNLVRFQPRVINAIEI